MFCEFNLITFSKLLLEKCYIYQSDVNPGLITE
jgi:hypothetical protein